MSLYKPSLSLYDVLNALGNQAPARDPREQLYRNQGYYPQPPAYRPYGYGSPARLPTGLVYKLPGDTCYYRPNYYYTGEDEDEEEDAEAREEELEKEEEELEREEEELEEAKRAQNGQQDTAYDQLPSYYHSRAPKGGVQDTYEESDPVRELLSAMLGGGPSFGPPPPQPPMRGSIGGDDVMKQALLEKLAQDFQDRGSESSRPQEAETEGRPVNQATKPKEKLPFPLNRKPSSASAQTQSSATEPLQVSKPEARLDLPFSPEVNVYDCPELYVVAVALPGATSKAFKVDYHPSTHELILKGDVEDKLGINEDYLKVTELKYGAFQRTIKFPIVPRIKDEEIRASYKNGILQVKVPKIAEISEKAIPKKRIVIEDVPDEELEYEEHPALAL